MTLKSHIILDEWIAGVILVIVQNRIVSPDFPTSKN